MLETYVNVAGHSVFYEPMSDTLAQAQVEISIVIHKGNSILDFSKEAVSSPIAIRGFHPDFLSIQRFLVKKGTYELEVELKDLKRPESEAWSMRVPMELDADYRNATFSDIELVAGLKQADPDSKTAKSGLDIIPYLSIDYPTEFNELIFYCELYHSEKELGKDQGFIVRYYLEDADREQIQGGQEVMKRKRTSPVLSTLGRLELNDIPTGRYNLVIEARDRDNKLLCSRETLVLRENLNMAKSLDAEVLELSFAGKMNDKDSLLERIYALAPIAGDKELLVINQQVDDFTLLQCKSFFYSFWEKRNPGNPEATWDAYAERLNEAEERFGTRNKRSYMTDMGRVFLKYGEPNSIVDMPNEPESYPFQIWHYYKAGRFTDRRFVFYDPELLRREYALLHSDVPGEIRNPRWDLIIHSRTNATWDQNRERGIGSASDRLQELYQTPR